MKANRFIQSLEKPESLLPITHLRQELLGERLNLAHEADQEKVSQQLQSLFKDDDDVEVKITDELPAKTVAYVVAECRALVLAPEMSGETWRAVKDFLVSELTQLRSLKEELDAGQRKLGMVQERLREAISPADGVVSKERIMAISMMEAESLYVCERLTQRVQAVIDQFVVLIIKFLEPGDERDERELRLRAAFAAV